MCTYKDIDRIKLPNGHMANQAASREIERIYTESWRRGVSVPFFDNAGNTFLANPDGSEDSVKLDPLSRTYHILKTTNNLPEIKASFNFGMSTLRHSPKPIREQIYDSEIDGLLEFRYYLIEDTYLMKGEKERVSCYVQLTNAEMVCLTIHDTVGIDILNSKNNSKRIWI